MAKKRKKKPAERCKVCGLVPYHGSMADHMKKEHSGDRWWDAKHQMEKIQGRDRKRKKKRNKHVIPPSGYAEYIVSPEWRRRAARIKARRGRCEECGATENLQAHHLNYIRLGCERDSDIRVLCGVCHQNRHKDKLMDSDNLEHLRSIAVSM